MVVRACVRCMLSLSEEFVFGASLCIVRIVVCLFREGCFLDELSRDTLAESLARDLSLNRTFGGRCAMPQFTVEVSWFEISVSPCGGSLFS